MSVARSGGATGCNPIGCVTSCFQRSSFEASRRHHTRLAPPAHAAVSAGRKSAIQALDRLDRAPAFSGTGRASWVRYFRHGPSPFCRPRNQKRPVIASTATAHQPEFSACPRVCHTALRQESTSRGQPLRPQTNSGALLADHPNVSLHYTPTCPGSTSRTVLQVQRHVMPASSPSDLVALSATSKPT